MSHAADQQLDPYAGSAERRGRRRWVRTISLALWAAVIAYEIAGVVISPTALNIFTTAAFGALCVAVNAEGSIVVVKWGHNHPSAR